jgi:hypothetical protein
MATEFFARAYTENHANYRQSRKLQHMINRSDHRFWHMCTQIFEHNILIPEVVVLNDEGKHHTSGSVSTTVSSWAMGLAENIYNMNGIVLK